MSSIKEGLYPDKILLVVQGGVYIASLFAAHILLIKPAIRLQTERADRTRGKRDAAAKLVVDGDVTSERFKVRMKEIMDEARKLRAQELAKGQAEVQRLMLAAQEASRARIQAARAEVEAELRVERQKISPMVDHVVNSIFAKLGVTVTLFSLVYFSLGSQAAQASGSVGVTMDSFGWPYFQFILFASVVFWGGRKVLPGMLAARRENLRHELAEAKALLDAAQKRAESLESQLAAVERDVTATLEQYKTDGIRESEKIVEEAHRAAVQMASDSERVVREAFAQGRESLRRELLDLALSAVQQRLTPERLAVLDEGLRLDAMQSVQKLPVEKGAAQ
jgi:F0F1-type ATP synthase membrane subunit b/b'